MAKIKAAKNGDKKDAIVHKAAALFRQKGYKATSMRELAEALNVEAPSLYNHIGSKEELLQAICFKMSDEFHSRLNEIEKSSGKIIDKVEAVIRFHVQMMLENFDEVFVANHDWKQLKQPSFNNFLNQRKSYEKRLVTLIEKGMKQKELKSTNAYVTVLTILSAVRGIEFWQRNKKNISAKELEN